MAGNKAALRAAFRKWCLRKVNVSCYQSLAVVPKIHPAPAELKIYFLIERILSLASCKH